LIRSSKRKTTCGPRPCLSQPAAILDKRQPTSVSV
jgi:hypothetical protein